MTVRRNGYSMTSKENFQGNPGFFTVLLDGAAVKFADSGVVQPLVEFKRHHIKSLLNPVNGVFGDISLLSVAVRTLGGNVLANDTAYEIAYHQQLNMNRLIDVVTQRATIIGSSTLNGDLTGKSVTTGANGAFSTALTISGNTSGYTFLAERYNVFEKEVGQAGTGVPIKQPYLTDNTLYDIIGTVPFYSNFGTQTVTGASDDVTGIAATVTVNTAGGVYTGGVYRLDSATGKGMTVTISNAGVVTSAVVSGGESYVVGDSFVVPGYVSGGVATAIVVATLGADEAITRSAGVFDSFDPIVR